MRPWQNGALCGRTLSVSLSFTYSPCGCRMEQCLVFCRTNFDCDNLERFFNALSGGERWRGPRESGRESPYSCVVLAGARSNEARSEALQV